jgi:hypothetical protein
MDRYSPAQVRERAERGLASVSAGVPLELVEAVGESPEPESKPEVACTRLGAPERQQELEPAAGVEYTKSELAAGLTPHSTAAQPGSTRAWAQVR